MANRNKGYIRPETAIKIGGILALGFVGGYSTYFLVDSERIRNVYTRDVNGDGISDVILTNKGVEKFIYIGQEDGSYRPLNKVLAEMKESKTGALESELDMFKGNIEAKVLDLE